MILIDSFKRVHTTTIQLISYTFDNYKINGIIKTAYNKDNPSALNELSLAIQLCKRGSK